MSCSVPPALTDDQICALLDGTALPGEQAHVSRCPYCSGRVAHARAVEQRLAATLRRWDCPPSQQLGEYHVGLLGAAEERTIARHLEACALCKAEIEELRLFLSPAPAPQPQAPSVSAPVRHRWGEVLARLVPQSPSLALRGSSRTPLIAEADGTTVIVDIAPAAHDRMVIGGQIAADDQERWMGALVEMRQAGLLKGTARVDDLGSWQSGPLPITTTDLRITPQTGSAILLGDLTLSP